MEANDHFCSPTTRNFHEWFDHSHFSISIQFKTILNLFHDFNLSLLVLVGEKKILGFIHWIIVFIVVTLIESFLQVSYCLCMPYVQICSINNITILSKKQYKQHGIKQIMNQPSDHKPSYYSGHFGESFVAFFGKPRLENMLASYNTSVVLRGEQ